MSSVFKRLIFAALSACALLPAPATAQMQHNQSAAPTTMTVEIRALANESPTSHVATLAVHQFADDADKAQRLTRERISRLTRELQPLGIEAIYTEFVALKPRYTPVFGKADKKSDSAPKVGEQLAGFDYSANVRISYGSSDLLPKILLAAAKQEIYDLLDVEQRHRNGETVFANLRQRCFDYFRVYLPELEDYGINAIDWQRYTEETREVFTIDQRQTLVTQSHQQTATTIAPQKGGMPIVERSIIAQKTYRRLPAETFHIVVNGDMVEPCMQFVYTLRFQFVVPVEGQKIEYKNEIILPPTPAPKPAPTYTPPLAPQD